MTSDEKIISILSEIRDLQSQQVNAHAEFLKKTEEKYDAYLGKSREQYSGYLKKVRNLLVGFVVVVILLLFIFPVVLSFME
ncbi:hypothetical protein IPM65_03100 [Candidatus Roizmanbacteria bacterium]|nr:MAG: hypothetical protein IPM65_03100 [Candidatus Roizmanbacteria bacterium]